MTDSVKGVRDTVMCDHICLKDDEHVARGEPHFYGYENPPPRITERTRLDIIRVARHVRSHDDRPFEEADRLIMMFERTENEHDHKGYSEEKCVRCGWVMGTPPLNCNNDNTPHKFPSQGEQQ